MVPEASISQGGLCCIENSKGDWGRRLGVTVGLSQKPKFIKVRTKPGIFRGMREGAGCFKPNFLCRRSILGQTGFWQFVV